MPIKSLKIFLNKLIDYAGLFPPANLNLNKALKKYREYIECDDSWIMSQFVIHLNDLENISKDDMEIFNDNFQLDFSVLSENLENDIEKLNQFKNQFSNKVKFSGLETLICQSDDLYNLLTSTNITIQNNNLKLSSFFELSYDKNWLKGMFIAVKTISKFNKLNKTNFGFKLRCGGIKANMFPDSNLVSNTILNCIKDNVPMKFTAGLHHPFRHFDDNINTKIYGFFNIFIGAMLAQKYKFKCSQLNQILLDENEYSFIFYEDKIKWKNFHITNDEIKQFRKSQFISFGSCSFDEPREDLIKLGVF